MNDQPLHAPGPWVLCYDGQIDDAKGNRVCSFAWDNYRDFNTDPQVKATARLIKAAPAMLEALKLFLTWIPAQSPEFKYEREKIASVIREAEDRS